jgi:hypothetical protein
MHRADAGHAETAQLPRGLSRDRAATGTERIVFVCHDHAVDQLTNFAPAVTGNAAGAGRIKLEVEEPAV